MAEIPKPALPSPEELRDLTGTLSAHPARRDLLASRLQYVADLLADAGTLPNLPLLVWRESDRTVSHQAIGAELVAGRKPGGHGLALGDDKALSRRHFTVRFAGNEFLVEDLKSHNGTALNEATARVHEQQLHDGDLIFAGNHVFAFLDQRRTR